MFLLINLNIKFYTCVINIQYHIRVHYLKNRKCENLLRIDLHLSFTFICIHGKFITFGINIHIESDSEEDIVVYISSFKMLCFLVNYAFLFLAFTLVSGCYVIRIWMIVRSGVRQRNITIYDRTYFNWWKAFIYIFNLPEKVIWSFTLKNRVDKWCDNWTLSENN